MGILDSFFGNADQTQALGLLGAGLMSGNAPGGFQAASGLLAQAPMRALQKQMAELQMAEMQDKIAQRQKQREFLDNLPDPTFAAGQEALAGGGGPTLANAANVPSVSPQRQMLYQATKAGVVGLPDYLKTLGPVEAPINKLDAKDFTPASLAKFSRSRNYADLERLDKLHFADTGGQIAALDPFTGQPRNQVAKTGDPFKDLLVNGPNGITPNVPLIDAKKQIAKSGAANTNISVNTEKSLLNEIAGGLGKAVTDARGNAQAALGTINTVNRMMDALDSGKVMAGPGTTFRQYGLQIGSLLGVTGKNAQEQMLNTRQAIQSLAQLELDAAQQMKGQGQITEAERAIIRRAASGDIDGMTTGELRLLGGVLDRTARFKIRGYNQQAAPLKNNPNAAPLAPFLDVQEPPARAQPNVLRFDANGNPVR